MLFVFIVVKTLKSGIGSEALVLSLPKKQQVIQTLVKSYFLSFANEKGFFLEKNI